jgi:hypothetical protein
MLLFILWRDTTSELWTLVQFLYITITVLLLLALFTFLQVTTFYHSIHLILCSQQTGEIDNLTVSWGKVLGCVVCRFHVAASEKLHADKLPSAIVRSVTKLAGINLRKCGSFSYWYDNLGLTNEGKLVAVLIITLLLGFTNKIFWRHQLGAINKFSGTVAREKEDFCKGSLSRPIFYFVIILLYFIFACIILSKKYKKLVPLIVCIPLLLLLVHYVVP